MFAARAARFRKVAEGHVMGDYLRFLGALSDAQHAIQDEAEEPETPPADALERAFSFGMPPIDRSRLTIDAAAHETFDRLLAAAVAIPVPEAAAAARARLASNPQARAAAMSEALEGAASVEALAEHVFASAALQVHFARLAAAIGAARLRDVGGGACPCCGGPPVASLVVGWGAAHGLRYVACALCGTLWNHVRVKCVACGSTKGIAYQELDDDAAIAGEESGLRARQDQRPVKGETCEVCRSYVKIFNQILVPDIDPVADDVATLGLDLKLREAGWARAGFNPYLLGY
jgi:FdhE protein